MEKPAPYEHRGRMYRRLTIASKSEADRVARMFRKETDIWLKKILASKLLDASADFACGVPESEIREATRCRVR